MGSVGADVGAEFCCVGLEPSTSRTAAGRPTTYAGGGLTNIASEKKLKVRCLCYCALLRISEAGKAFIYMTNINCLVTTLYEVFNRLKVFPFFLLWGIKVGIERKHNLPALFGNLSEHSFPARSRV